MRVIKGKKDLLDKKAEEIRKRKKKIYEEKFWFYFFNKDYDDFGDKQALYCGLMLIGNYRDEDLEYPYQAYEYWKVIEMVREIIKRQTYREMICMYPVRKEYDGWKYEAKDYFSTMEYLAGVDMDEKIGDGIDDFLWNYYNSVLMQFSIKTMLVMDMMRRAEGRPSIAESFADTFGVDTYILHPDKGYAYNTSTCRTTPIKPFKRKNRNMKVVK